MRHALEVLALAVALTLGGCAGLPRLSLDDALAVIPYELQTSGRILVDVHLDEHGPYSFALDTAASVSSFFENAELGLEPLPDVETRIRGLATSGNFPRVRVDELRVGSVIWPDAELVLLPGETTATRTIAGILGIDFLRRYGIGFSARERVLSLFRPDRIDDERYRGWASVALEPVHIGESREPLYFFRVSVDGYTVPALFDLGAGLNLMNPAAARSLRLGPTGRRNGNLLSGALGEAPVLARLDSQDIVTGLVRWRNEVFLIADLEVFEALELDEGPLAILGVGLFNQRDFVIDFVRNRLLVRVAMSEVDAGTSKAAAPE